MLYNSTNYANLEYKSIDPIEQFLNLIKLPEVQAVLHLLVENIIITSDLDILKRITSLEEKSECAIPVTSPTIPPNKSTLVQKATALVDHLKTNVPARLGAVYLTTKETIHFIKHGLPESLRVHDIQNYRQAKKDIIEKAAQICPDILLNKKKSGNHEVRLVYRSVCTDPVLHTYGGCNNGSKTSCYHG